MDAAINLTLSDGDETKILIQTVLPAAGTFQHYISKHGLDESKCAETHSDHVLLFFVYMSVHQQDQTMTVPHLKSALLKYKAYLEQKVTVNIGFLKQRTRLLRSLTYFIEYLWEDKKIDIRPDYSLLELAEPVFDDLGSKHFRGYIRSFTSRNYTNVEDKIYAVSFFLRHIPVDAANLETLKLEHVKTYETVYVAERVLREEITCQTARRHLDQLKHFFNYLRNLGVIRFPYAVPQHFFGTETRDNEYVSEEDLLQFYHTLQNANTATSKMYLCIFLFLVETGCRPIEVCNLKLSDFNVSESTVSLTSIKSDRRTLKIDHYVKEYLVNFLHQQRKCLLPNEPLFCTKEGTPLKTRHISRMFQNYNLRTFGQIVFSAKTLRHNFVTNALDDKNDFDKVSKAAGHKQWRSTMHYFHRSVKRLVKNTMNHNPNKRSS